MAARKIRLDRLLVDQGLAENCREAWAFITAGRVLVQGGTVRRADHLLDCGTPVSLRPEEPFASRAGRKLEHALTHFGIDPAGKICADIGAAHGGFTDCLLLHNALRVYAVDVGYGQLCWELRQDPRVVVLERTNARHLSCRQVPETLDFAVVDVSFISAVEIISALCPLFRKEIAMIVLVKPQFEAPRHLVGKGGIVTDAAVRRQAVAKVVDAARLLTLHCAGETPSPITGVRGNQEYLLYLRSA